MANQAAGIAAFLFTCFKRGDKGNGRTGSFFIYAKLVEGGKQVEWER